MKRRFFLKLSGIFTAITFCGIPLPLFGTSSKQQTVYPGKIIRFDNINASSMGPWAG